MESKYINRYNTVCKRKISGYYKCVLSIVYEISGHG